MKLNIMSTLTKLSNEPWCIMDDYHHSLSKLYNDYVSKIYSADFAGILESIEKAINEEPCYKKENEMGYIYVDGIMSSGIGKLEKMMGMIDTDELIDAIDDMEEDETIKNVMFVINSGGGSVTGIPELANKIKNMTKPNCAYIQRVCGSAAYWISSQCNIIYASESAYVGSVGVYQSWMDISKAYENMGIKQELIKNTNGTMKAVPMPSISINETQRERMQQNIDKIYEMFKSAIKSERNIDEDTMDGSVYMGEEARVKGYVDGICDYKTALSICKEL